MTTVLRNYCEIQLTSTGKVTEKQKERARKVQDHYWWKKRQSKLQKVVRMYIKHTRKVPCQIEFLLWVELGKSELKKKSTVEVYRIRVMQRGRGKRKTIRRSVKSKLMEVNIWITVLGILKVYNIKEEVQIWNFLM